MPSPKHLWSGDWQDESAAAAARRRPAEPAPQPRPTPPQPASSSWRNWRLSVAAVLAVLLIAGVAIALLTPGGSERSNAAATVPSAQVPQGSGGGGVQPNPGQISPSPVNPGGGLNTLPGLSQTAGSQGGAWLGVDVGSTSSGVEIEGIVAGGPADAAALRPGDLLLAIDGRAIGSLRDLSAVVADLRPGQTITLRLRRNGQTITRPLIVGTNPSASAASP